MNSIITLTGSSKSMGFIEKILVVSLRKGSNEGEDEDSLEDFFLETDFLVVEAVSKSF